ncbi:50S ribosomal protein L24 [Robiginitomaculum antarcticum]|uniref:50S ribosomal protein L24 n=1 Tax=Robiginitomaculum antarcticum TaxID=437507 RepID=UPI00036D310F|nr:50S ribosomal protein L24 [Robiginitomaculum antarcticum]
MAAKIKKGDHVIVIAGKDKGKKGEVSRVIPSADKIIVSGVNVVTRHVKPTQADPDGGIRRFEGAIHVSNVAAIDPKDSTPTRVGFKTLKDGKKVRVAKKSGEVLDV